jgi:hypothetical protein
VVIIDIRITNLGLILLAASYALPFLMLRRLRSGNAPEKLPSQSYAAAFAGKIFGSIILSLLAAPVENTPLFGFIAPIRAYPMLVGGGYFIASLALDMVFIAVFYRGEFYNSYKIVLGNIIYIPFVTAIASLIAVYVEQGRTVRRVRSDLPKAESDGVLLGYAVEMIRTIQKPVRGLRDVDVKKHYDIRPVPQPIPVYYRPRIGDRDLNPHMIVAGSSGTGKTTTIYHMVTELARMYPVILIDVKGDLSRAILKKHRNNYVIPVARTGIDPFTRMHRESESEMVEGLMASISVVEEVGSRQAHFIREAYARISHSNQRLTYTRLVRLVEELEKASLEGRIRYGPTTRDALFSIAVKLQDLGAVLKDGGASLAEIVKLAVKDRRENFPVVVLNLEGIGEKVRAIVLELILRKLSIYLTSRGPLAYLTEKPLVLVVDEAYLVTRPMDRHGRRGEESKSILETIARAGRSYGVALILVTQRLSDIADGIRQNCDKWVVFRTSSPEDLNIVRVGGDVLSEVVTHLGKGYAYIRLVNPRRLEGYRYTSEIMAVTDGYIFSMERRLLDIEVRKRRKNYSWTELATICYRCNAVIKDIHNCHICKKPPMLIKPIQEETVETNTAQNNGQAGAGNTKPNGNGKHGKKDVNVEEVSDKLIEEARKLALREIIREEDKKVLSSISLELLRKLISCVRSGKFDEELFTSGLAVNEDGKIRPTRGARLFLKSYKFVKEVRGTG